MANTKPSAFTAVSALQDTDTIPFTRDDGAGGWQDRKIPISDARRELSASEDTYATLRTALAAGAYQAGQMVFVEGRASTGDSGQGMGQVVAIGANIDDGFDTLVGGGLAWKRVSGGYFEVAAILRTNADGSWELLDDTDHTPLNAVSASVSSSLITLTFSRTAAEVVSFSVTADETLGKDFVAGASVGLSDADIRLHSLGYCGGYIYYDGSSWRTQLADLVTGGTWVSGELELAVPEYIDGFKACVDARDGAVLASIASTNYGAIKVRFHDYSGTQITTPNTNMKFRLLTGSQTIDPAKVKSDVFPNGNLWVRGLFRA